MENNRKRDLVGYVTVRKFAGYALPVPIQNKLLRDYCIENKFNYVLPLCELYIPNNYMSLFGTLERVSIDGNIGMASIYMFPKDTKKFHSLNTIIKEKKISFHFIFEDKNLNYNEIEEFYLYSKMRYITAKKPKIKF